MQYVDIFRPSATVQLKFVRGTFDPLSLEVKSLGGRGQAHSITHTWAPISSSLAHVISYRFLFTHLAGPKSVFRCPSFDPFDSDTMPITALETRFVEREKL